MNNLVFNTEAKELKTTIYAKSPGGSINVLNLDGDGNLRVNVSSGSITIGATVTISNQLLTIAGTVTVANPITIANELLTVAGTVTVGNDITIANSIISVNNVLII